MEIYLAELFSGVRGGFTAHNYKKCGKGILGINKIKELGLFIVVKSVVKFGMVQGLWSGSAIDRPSPLSKILQACPYFYTITISKLDIFRKGFYKWVGRFQKVGGLGGVW